MQDGIIMESGDSRYLRFPASIDQQCPTYESFLALGKSGQLPIDWAGINPDGWAQLGTFLNKANLLTDATAALVDLGPEATPNEMLAALANAVETAVSTANTAKSTAQYAQSAASSAQSSANTAYNRISYGTSDLTAGSSSLSSGTVYLVYE